MKGMGGDGKRSERKRKGGDGLAKGEEGRGREWRGPMCIFLKKFLRTAHEAGY